MKKMVLGIKDSITVQDFKMVRDKNHTGIIKNEISEKSYCFKENFNKRVLHKIDDNHIGTLPFGY